jgi:D-alanyl-D-alanine carboxypeptidase
MFMKIISILAATLILMLFCTIPTAEALKRMCKDPYTGAIAVDAASGTVLFEDSADARAYPASVIKLMVLLIILEGIEAHYLTPDELVTVTSEASTIGGS